MTRRVLKTDEKAANNIVIKMHPSTLDLLKKTAEMRGYRKKGTPGHCTLARELVEQALGVRRDDKYVAAGGGA